MTETKAVQQDKDESASFILSTINKYFIEPDFFNALLNFNFAFIFGLVLALLAGYSVNYLVILIYIPSLIVIASMRKSRIEKRRLAISHSIPLFADTLANALSVGNTLEQSFIQASYFLKGQIKSEFDKLILKNKLGRNLGATLREIDAKFPNTGLMYLISLLDAYSELGVGISPLLKRISIVLSEKEKAEEKIRTILSAGSNYARLAIGIFSSIFITLAYLLREQAKALLEPDLRPIFLFLVGWTFAGIFVVMRISSLNFTKTFAMKPYIAKFLATRKLTFDEMLYYTGLNWTPLQKQMFSIAPLFIGFIGAYFTSWYSHSLITIFFGFAIVAGLSWFFMKNTLQGMLEDQLIRSVEAFPEYLQVFNIGLNSGLNTYLAFQFALNSMEKSAPLILIKELNRSKMAISYGENPAKTWQILSKNLPFETISDFSEIMVAASLHGESIETALTRMYNNYQEKKLLFIEKKATKLSQIVIPVIIVAFLPLFLFVMFAPLINKIKLLVDL